MTGIMASWFNSWPGEKKCADESESKNRIGPFFRRGNLGTNRALAPRIL
jgi:hypothetical protein